MAQVACGRVVFQNALFREERKETNGNVAVMTHLMKAFIFQRLVMVADTQRF